MLNIVIPSANTPFRLMGFFFFDNHLCLSQMIFSIVINFLISKSSILLSLNIIYICNLIERVTGNAFQDYSQLGNFFFVKFV